MSDKRGRESNYHSNSAQSFAGRTSRSPVSMTHPLTPKVHYHPKAIDVSSIEDDCSSSRSPSPGCNDSQNLISKSAAQTDHVDVTVTLVNDSQQKVEDQELSCQDAAPSLSVS